MRRALVLIAFVFVSLTAPSAGAMTITKPPLPCDYWVHGCNVTAYACDAGICVEETLPAIKP